MAISASVSAPTGDAPVRFPNTRAKAQPTLAKDSGRSGYSTSSSAIQVIAVVSYLLVKWTWSWLQSRKSKPPTEDEADAS